MMVTKYNDATVSVLFIEIERTNEQNMTIKIENTLLLLQYIFFYGNRKSVIGKYDDECYDDDPDCTVI